LTRIRLLDELATVGVAMTALPIADVARVTSEQTGDVSVAFLVCGSGATTQQLRLASTRFALGVEVIAVVCDPDRTPGLRRVSGLSVLTIGFLEDLQASLSRAVTR
jgi:fructoselysine-6-P-deglycase FrlB-like protein